MLNRHSLFVAGDSKNSFIGLLFICDGERSEFITRGDRKRREKDFCDKNSWNKNKMLMDMDFGGR
jgi:hypothetical protein